MAGHAKLFALALLIAAVKLVSIVLWAVAIAIGGGLFLFVGMAICDLVTGIAAWHPMYAAHLGYSAGSIVTGLCLPLGAMVAASRFTHDLKNSSEPATITIPVACICYAGVAALIVLPLLVNGMRGFDAYFTTAWLGSSPDVAPNAHMIAAKLRIIPFLVLGHGLVGLMEPAK